MPLFSASNLYIYTDDPGGVCPAGTTAANKYTQIIINKALAITNGIFNCANTAAQPAGYLECYSQSVGSNLICYELKGTNYQDPSTTCIWERITYDSLAMCKWGLP